MVDTTKSFTEQVLELTNDFRQKNGLKPLKWDPQLATAAQKHSDNMGKQDFFSHTGKDGSKLGDRIRAAGDDSRTFGENIAAGQRTPEQVVQGWMNSPGHRRNILNPNFESIGVGYHQEKPDTGSVNYQHYWTQNFGGGGTPPDATSVSNNSPGNSNNANTPSNNFNNNFEASTDNNNSGDNSPSAGLGNNNSPSNSSNDFTKQVLQLTNDFRQENGLKPLTWDPELATAAQKHSDNMGKQDFFSHTGKDGSKLGDRIRAAGDDSRTFGENIAAGQRTPEQVVQGWMNSPGHRRNILNPNFESIGVGYHQEKPDTGSVNYQHYWTQNFGGGGTPPNGTSVSNNSEASTNNSGDNNPGINSGGGNIGDRPGGENSGDNTGNYWSWSWKNSDFGSNDTGKDLLMGQANNEALAGDFGNTNTAMKDSSSPIENYNPDLIWGQNQSQNFQTQNSQNEIDSMLPTEANYDGLGSCQLSPEKLMGLGNNFLAELNQIQGEQLSEFTKQFGNLNNFL